jgi:hypothetical protein
MMSRFLGLPRTFLFNNFRLPFSTEGLALRDQLTYPSPWFISLIRGRDCWYPLDRDDTDDNPPIYPSLRPIIARAQEDEDKLRDFLIGKGQLNSPKARRQRCPKARSWRAPTLLRSEWAFLGAFGRKSQRIRAAAANIVRAERQAGDVPLFDGKRPTKLQLDDLKKFTGSLWSSEFGNKSFTPPPKLTALTDEAVYWVTKQCTQAERGANYLVDFDANGDTKRARAPMGPPPIVMVNGFHCLPVWKGSQDNLKNTVPASHTRLRLRLSILHPSEATTYLFIFISSFHSAVPSHQLCLWLVFLQASSSNTSLAEFTSANIVFVRCLPFYHNHT